jgi:hypothetical protein
MLARLSTLPREESEWAFEVKWEYPHPLSNVPYIKEHTSLLLPLGVFLLALMAHGLAASRDADGGVLVEGHAVLRDEFRGHRQ